MAKRTFTPFFLDDTTQLNEGDHLRIAYVEDGVPDPFDGWVYRSSRGSWRVVHIGGDWDVERDIIAEGMQAQVIGRRWHAMPSDFLWCPE